MYLLQGGWSLGYLAEGGFADRWSEMVSDTNMTEPKEAI